LIVKTRTMINEKCFTILGENIKTSTKLALDRRDPGVVAMLAKAALLPVRPKARSRADNSS
jgi:hypothetical protein